MVSQLLQAFIRAGKPNTNFGSYKNIDVSCEDNFTLDAIFKAVEQNFKNNNKK